ncbi:hypothetical protein CIK05_07020 [Bdellovibrio sp. qaytius]|nr:hypothetical protein CIK05_07020 [Bdellovibrio sp. qaytius]
MKTFITILFATLFVQTTYARNWDRIEIPGAVCGDGLPYSVFVNTKANSKNLLVEFMGGGACWNFETCYGVNLDGVQFRTWMHPLPEIPFYSYMTSDMWLWSDHPFNKDSALYLPYCTGDVFSADHTAEYSGVKAHHQGYRNILLTFAYLNQKNILNFSRVERLTVWGASAGAIGAFVHLKNIEPYFPRASKIAIIDSAGLHFGPTFWHKFTSELFNDFSEAFAKTGMQLDYNDGFIAKRMGPVLAGLKQWTIGIMQSTRDPVMSTSFGEISPEEHRKLVLSDEGIAAVARPYANTSVWIADIDIHTFLLLETTSRQEDMQNQSAINFVDYIVDKSALTNRQH